MSSLSNKKTNLIINLSLVILIVGMGLLSYFIYVAWQTATPDSYTSSSSAESSTLAVQLQDHIDPEIYKNLAESVDNYLSEDINFVTIRPDTYTRADDSIVFLSDIAGTSATYRFVIDTEDVSTSIRCPELNEQRDTSWSCNPTLTGDPHED